MSRSAYTTVRTARTSLEADQIISRLRDAGLHPLDLSMSADFTLGETEAAFPVQVAAAEAAAAQAFLDACDRPTPER